MDPKALCTTAFCGKKIDNVTNNNTKLFILNDLSLKTGVKYSNNYAKVFNPRFSKNLNNPHIICTKTHGNPYLLFCTQINGVNYTLLIDKKVKTGYEYPKMFVLHYKFSDEIYNGTLIECELVKDNYEEWFLLLADIYAYKGSNMSSTMIINRINIIYSILENDFKKDSQDICPVFVKRYFDYSDYKDIMLGEFLPSLNYKCRGLYFVPINPKYSKILYLFKDDEVGKIYEKKKNAGNSLIRFKIVKTLKSDVYDLYIKEKDTLKKHGLACLPSMKSSKMVRGVFGDCKELEDIIMECQFNKRFEKWEPIKHIPNGNVSDIKLLDQ